ncbi:MAG TPA: hypothetical protein VMF53_10315 [Alphaproteobacteria bacterium]|nr:hypothetical protein [Alphaproteobacteria bacterium]
MARRFYSLIAASAIGTALLAGCDRHQMSIDQDSDLGAYQVKDDVRIVFDRKKPTMDSSGHSTVERIICTEPSPDIAKALSTALALTGSATTPTGLSASAGLNYSSAEAITALAGRTEAVVALRDGLFKACEAYANGVIPDLAYALILSQYGDLLVTLMLGEAAGNAAQKSGASTTGGSQPAGGQGGGSGTGTPAAVSVSVNGAPATTTQQKASPSPASDTKIEGYIADLMKKEEALEKLQNAPAATAPSADSLNAAQTALNTATSNLAQALTPSPAGSSAQNQNQNQASGGGEPVAAIYQTYMQNAPFEMIHALFAACILRGETGTDGKALYTSNAVLNTSCPMLVNTLPVFAAKYIGAALDQTGNAPTQTPTPGAGAAPSK